MENGFTEGVSYGGLREQYQVNILVSYLLRSVKQPLTISELQSACVKDGLTNYFELNNALSELIQLEQVEEITSLKDEKSYQLTVKGREHTDLLLRDIPLSVRNRALQNIMQLIEAKSALDKIYTSINKTEDGYLVQLIIPDLGSDLMDLTLFAPDLESARKIETCFKKDPSVFYNGVWDLLTNDFNSIQ